MSLHPAASGVVVHLENMKGTRPASLQSVPGDSVGLGKYQEDCRLCRQHVCMQMSAHAEEGTQMTITETRES